MGDIIQGTNISSPIVPFTIDDEFPTHDAKYGKGGFRAVRTISERDNITSYRKDEGMFVFVIEEDKLFYFKNNSWQEWSSDGGGGGTGISEVYTFSTPSTTWTIPHGLGLYPSVTTVDSTGEVILGDVTYVDDENITVTFGEAVSGKAFIN